MYAFLWCIDFGCIKRRDHVLLKMIVTDTGLERVGWLGKFFLHTKFLVADADLLLVAVATMLVTLLDAVSTAQGISTTIPKTTKLARATLVKSRAGRGSDDHGEDKEESDNLVDHCCCCCWLDWWWFEKDAFSIAFIYLFESNSWIPPQWSIIIHLGEQHAVVVSLEAVQFNSSHYGLAAIGIWGPSLSLS